MRRNTIFLAMVFPFTLIAQETELFETLNFQHAVKSGTRSRTGDPGAEYWQNHADYDMAVRLDTASKRIHGKEHITYFNQSPDTLATIVLRLYQNRYKKGAIRDAEVHPGNIHDGMDLDTILVNGTGISPASRWIRTNGTNLSIPLTHPLMPGSTLRLYCEWNYHLPMEPEFRRTGYYKDDAWFIGYFYPQIAVYDDMEFLPLMKGWDYGLFHKGIQEFYNDFNNYQVRIEVPEGFFVWATGDLTNEEEVYTGLVRERLAKARTTDQTVKIISEDELDNKMLAGNIWKFKASGVPDFAFGTALRYLWDGTSVQAGERRVLVDVAYHPGSEFYPRAIDVARKTVKYASEVFPGIPYPYAHATTFNGMLRGGMEFPMIANNSDERDTVFMILMTYHEICHNYHPFMTGINEKRYHFMDEGLTQLSTMHFLWDEYGLDFYSHTTVSARATGIFEEYSQSCMATQDNSSLYNAYTQNDNYNEHYQYVVKPVVPLLLFSDMVGEARFRSAYREFVRRWEGKHPTPFDLFYTMNDVLDENFNWFWNAWYMDFGYPDLGIALDGHQLIVRRVGGRALPLPINLTIEYKNGTSTCLSRPMDIWRNGARAVSIEIEDPDGVKSIMLHTENVPDIDHGNNYLTIE
jgi:hypothetical protein